MGDLWKNENEKFINLNKIYAQECHVRLKKLIKLSAKKVSYIFCSFKKSTMNFILTKAYHGTVD